MIFSMTSDYFQSVFIILFDSENMGPDTSFAIFARIVTEL